MHPGWADTPGVAEGLPGFHRVMGPLLRPPEQGADTVVWLAGQPDRRRRPGAGCGWTGGPGASTGCPGPVTPADRRVAEGEALWAWCASATAGRLEPTGSPRRGEQAAPVPPCYQRGVDFRRTSVVELARQVRAKERLGPRARPPTP